jgi:precorrin isomerase
MPALKSMKQLREDLGWSNSPRIEQMLIERIVLAWQYLHWAKLMNTQAGKCSLSHAKYNQERIDRANKRYLSATKMLAMIRKMALPLRIDVKAEVTVAESKSSAMVPRSRFDLVNSTN